MTETVDSDGWENDRIGRDSLKPQFAINTSYFDAIYVNSLPNVSIQTVSMKHLHHKNSLNFSVIYWKCFRLFLHEKVIIESNSKPTDTIWFIVLEQITVTAGVDIKMFIFCILWTLVAWCFLVTWGSESACFKNSEFPQNILKIQISAGFLQTTRKFAKFLQNKSHKFIQRSLYPSPSLCWDFFLKKNCKIK